jgi:EmrB/QacA subfamily drug resistance transporter
MNRQQKLVIIISILASFVAFLDGSVVNVALPAIVDELGGGLAVQQWVVDAYLITLGSLIMIAGSLSDLFGRKKVLVAGLVGFAAASILCAIAPTSLFLIISRGLQGAAGALLVPSSLALIISVFRGPAGGKAIGTWTAWTGVAFLVGPLLGGFLVDVSSWRLIFAINIIPIAVTLLLMKNLEEPMQRKANVKVDFFGAALGVVALGGPVYALIEQANYGWSDPMIYMPMLIGLIALALFIWYENQIAHPMLPLSLFKIRNFNVGNLATFVIYGGLAVATFLITVFIQQVGGYTAFNAGLALIPVTLIMFVLSPKFGALSGKLGPRLFMSLGPIVAGIGFLLMLRVGNPVAYWLDLLPGVLFFGLGLSITVAPLTTAILGSIKPEEGGIGSAVNNAVSRIAGLVAIAVLGIVTGPNLDLAGFRRGILATAFLMIFGGIISAIGIVNPRKAHTS